MHKSLDEFEIRPDLTMDYGVGCLSASEKNTHRLIMWKMVSVPFLGYFSIRSFLYLQVRTLMSLNFG